MKNIFKLIYISSSSKSINEQGIEDIVNRSKLNNPKHNISGALLYRSGFFLQLLEGDKEDVKALFTKIKKDPRHENIISLLEMFDEHRIFPDWSMAYREMSELDLKMVNEILSWTKLINRSPQIDNQLVIEILNRFKKELLTKK